MSRVNATALAIAGLLFCSVASAQVQRSFVASHGSDSNTATNCGFANPCRGFTAAQSVTNSGGEIVALDAAGYGAITITKSISIIANPGFYAGISASTGNAVTIATASVNVRLSGLRINGIGATNGVLMTNGASLTIDNCTISGFSNNGVEVTTAAKVRMVGSLVMNNGAAGLFVARGGVGSVSNSKFLGNQYGVWAYENVTAGTTTTISVSNSIAAGNTHGFVAQADVASTAKISVSNSSADDNITAGIGAYQAGGGVALAVFGSTKATHNGTGVTDYASGAALRSAGNNLVNDNATNTLGTITNVGTM